MCRRNAAWAWMYAGYRDGRTKDQRQDFQVEKFQPPLRSAGISGARLTIKYEHKKNHQNENGVIRLSSK